MAAPKLGLSLAPSATDVRCDCCAGSMGSGCLCYGEPCPECARCARHCPCVDAAAAWAREARRCSCGAVYPGTLPACPLCNATTPEKETTDVDPRS